MPVRPWLHLARVSNLPTVWANVLAGLAWGWWCLQREAANGETGGGETYALVLTDPTGRPLAETSDFVFILNASFAPLLAGTLLYVAGMIHNDAADARVDAAERPGRPVPAGRVSRRAAYAAAAALYASGVLGAGLSGSRLVVGAFVGLALLAAAYNQLHQRFAASITLVAACRALLATAAGLLFFAPDLAPTPLRLVHPAALFVYTLLVATVARQEVRLARVPLVIALLCAMPLLDAAFAGTAGVSGMAAVCLGLAVLAAAAQRFVRGS